MKLTQEERESIQKHVEKVITNAAQQVDGLTVKYLPDLVRGQIGSKFLELVNEVLAAIEE